MAVAYAMMAVGILLIVGGFVLVALGKTEGPATLKSLPLSISAPSTGGLAILAGVLLIAFPFTDYCRHCLPAAPLAGPVHVEPLPKPSPSPSPSGPTDGGGGTPAPRPPKPAPAPAPAPSPNSTELASAPTQAELVSALRFHIGEPTGGSVGDMSVHRVRIWLALTSTQKATISRIEYRFNHPSWHNPKVGGSPDSGFSSSWNGYGCVQDASVTALLKNGSEVVAPFDFCDVWAKAEDG